MIVLDASAAMLGLLNDGDARHLMAATESIAVPHLADAEIANALRAMVRRESLESDDARKALGAWAELGISRFSSQGLLSRVWDLRDNLTAYDATYVALAEAFQCPLVTADARLASAPGPTGQITIVRT